MQRTSFFSMRKIHLILGILLIAGLAFASFGYTQVNGRPPGSDKPKWVPLFTAAGAERAGAIPIAPQAFRHRAVMINPLVSEAGGVAVGDLLFISPFEDGAVLGTIDRVETDVNGVVAVRAWIQGSDGYLLLSSDKGRSLGRLVLPDRRGYEISCTGGGTTHIIQEFAPGARIALYGGPPLIPPKPAISRPVLPPLATAAAADANTQIDTMIVYTPAARDYANLSSGINNYISLAMQLGQLGMDNSQTGITLRLVYSGLVDYTESGSSATDLSRLTNTGDGYMDQVHTWRNTYGADLVHLFTKVEDTGGLGWLLQSPSGDPAYAFCLGRIQQVSWTTTTVHEWGHNMGCHHRKDQPTQPGPGLFSYSAGWRWVGTNTSKYCSIMSYQDAFGGISPTQVEYFSNPSVLYQGTPTGDAVDGDNARTLREIKTVISNYRAEVGTYVLTVQSSPDSEATVTVSPTDVNGQGTGSTTYTRRYNSGTEVNLTAPTSYNGKEFEYWKVDGGSSLTTNAIYVPMGTNHTAVAYYLAASPITVNSPNGGEAWIIGATQGIAWGSSGVSGNVNIFLYKGTSNLGAIATNIPVGNGVYNWKTGYLKNGTRVALGSTYRVSIVSALNKTIKAMSKAYFSLVKPKISVKTPGYGTIWRINSVQRITWTYSAVSGTVNIFLYRNGVLKGQVAANVPVGDMSFSWTVGALNNGGMVPLGAGYAVRVMTSDGNVSGKSRGTFTIRS